MDTIKEIFENKDLLKFLSFEGIMDESDGEIFCEYVTTSDTLQSIKDSCSEYKGSIEKTFNGVLVTQLLNFQKTKGEPRCVATFISNITASGQNIIFFL